METNNRPLIKIETIIDATIGKAWEYWTTPEHITKWYSASEDWHAPFAENDLIVGGKFLTRMEAKDGSFGFDFWGIYDEIKVHRLISATLGDGRSLEIVFTALENGVQIAETFEPETTNSNELQKAGWQAILEHFKKYVEET